LPEIRRTSAGPRVKLGTEELHLLSRLVEDIDEMLAATADDTRTREANDPLVELTGLDLAAAETLSPPVDPALRRLLPDAYRDDDEAAAEFRRYTENTLRGAKRADATVVRQGLASIGVMGERVLDDEQVHAWLRFLTDARLVLASRLGIEKADDVDALERLAQDDPRALAYAVYEWLMSLLAELLAVIEE